MNNLNNTTLISSLATLILALITFIQVFISTKGCVILRSDFITFNNYYYLVLKNVGNNCCRVWNVHFYKSTRELLRLNNVLLDNVSKYDCLPFSGFKGSYLVEDESKYCRIDISEIFSHYNRNKDIVKNLKIEGFVFYTFRFLIIPIPAISMFSIGLEEYLSIADANKNSESNKDNITYLANCISDLRKVITELLKVK